ncbi:cytochrome c oxidase assembly protein [Tepidamorphus sp. 3E244]|uniref:cytochrome c oxidase assembly protein n=1 Tax=Tepidamorphus sp. 3E244 TaxID=3385498 RepID=UPI0038FC5B9F
MANDNQTTKAKGGSNARTALVCASVVAIMTGAAFAAVPLYDLFCRTTGFGGTTQRAEASSGQVLDQTISVRFDANVSNDLNWAFRPEKRETRVKVGENALMIYVARNDDDRETTGSASFNVTPPAAGQYFVKVECFCFTEQTLAAGEQVDMPVAYYIDPAIVDDPDMTGLPEITLSYTFFPTEKEDSPSVSQAPATLPKLDRVPQGG